MQFLDAAVTLGDCHYYYVKLGGHPAVWRSKRAASIADSLVAAHEVAQANGRLLRVAYDDNCELVRARVRRVLAWGSYAYYGGP